MGELYLDFIDRWCSNEPEKKNINQKATEHVLLMMALTRNDETYWKPAGFEQLKAEKHTLTDDLRNNCLQN